MTKLTKSGHSVYLNYEFGGAFGRGVDVFVEERRETVDEAWEMNRYLLPDLGEFRQNLVTFKNSLHVEVRER